MASLIQFLLALLLAINTANGLTCYQCDSTANSLCNIGFTSFLFPATECGTGSTIFSLYPKQCAKIVAIDKYNKEYVARGCIPYLAGKCNVGAKVIGLFSYLADDNIKELSCFTCDGDKCNSAMKISRFSFATGLIIATAIAFLL